MRNFEKETAELNAICDAIINDCRSADRGLLTPALPMRKATPADLEEATRISKEIAYKVDAIILEFMKHGGVEGAIGTRLAAMETDMFERYIARAQVLREAAEYMPGFDRRRALMVAGVIRLALVAETISYSTAEDDKIGLLCKEFTAKLRGLILSGDA